MILKTFGPHLHDLTPDKKPNFIWATKRYFNQISKDKNLADVTIEKEFREYANVFKAINLSLPIYDYDENELDEILKRIEKNSYGSLDSVTIKHSYTHLVFRPCLYYFAEFQKDDNPLWGSAFSLENLDFVEKNITTILKRSFTEKEEKKLVDYLLKNPNTDIGENIGLATSFCTGTRDNESCGLNYGDISEMIHFQKEYYLKIYESTVLHSNVLKSGGKTFNAARLIVLIDSYIDFINKRIDYLNSVLTFPISDENGTFNSVNDLPISCRGNNYTKRCRADDLSKAGRILFRDILKMRESEVAVIDAARLLAIEDDVVEKDVTTYAFRRNFATHCYNLGFSDTELQYIMGHVITDLRYRRSDFIDEDYQHVMHEKLKNIAINKYYFDSK